MILGDDNVPLKLCLQNKEMIVRLMQEGTCFICGKTGYKLPLSHIYLTHGIGADYIKDALLINRDTGLCDPELSRTASAHKKVSGFDPRNAYRGPFNNNEQINCREKRKAYLNRPENIERFRKSCANNLDVKRKISETMKRKIATDEQYKSGITKRLLSGNAKHIACRIPAE